MPTVTIDEERLERLKDAVALASGGAFEQAIDSLRGATQDGFGEIEEMLQVFFADLRAMNQEVEEAIARLEAAKHALEEKLETIEAQQSAIERLSTPIVDAWKGILAVPLIGPIDGGRALAMSDKLLRRIADKRARWVLVDLTGVDAIDAATAEHLIRLSAAARLLGCSFMLTGMRPEGASAMVSLGVDLVTVKSLPSLEAGLRYCLAEDRRHARP